jgi:hypothetical protein
VVRPRLTHDVVVVVEPKLEQVEGFRCHACVDFGRKFISLKIKDIAVVLHNQINDSTTTTLQALGVELVVEQIQHYASLTRA